MPITNTTNYTLELLYSFNRHHIRTKCIIYYSICALTTVFSFLCSLVFLFALIHPDIENPSVLRFLCLLFILGFDTYTILATTVLLKWRVKKQPCFNSHSEYTFYEDELVETSSTDNVSASSTVKYAQVYKVTENKHCIFIYMSGNQAFLIDKSGFTNGTAEQLRVLLRSKVDAKKLKLK